MIIHKEEFSFNITSFSVITEYNAHRKNKWGLGNFHLAMSLCADSKKRSRVGGLDSTVRAKVSRLSSDLLVVCCQKPTG